MRLPAALLCDQDGTLVNTEPLWLDAESSLVESVGAYLDEETHARIVGSALSETVSLLLEISDLAMTPDQVGDALVNQMTTLLNQHVPWMEGAQQLLLEAKDRGIPTALVTSSHRSLAEAVNRVHPAGGFDVMITGDGVPHPKPAPDSYLMAAHALGVDIHDCLVLEDSPRGVQAGLSSGAQVVAIPCVTFVPAQVGLNRLQHLTDLTWEVVDQIMSGQTVDAWGLDA